MLQPIEMIFVSSTEGILTPLKFRIIENDQVKILVVKNAVQVDENRYNGIKQLIYRAKIIDKELGISREDKLFYDIVAMKWYINNPNFVRDFSNGF